MEIVPGDFAVGLGRAAWAGGSPVALDVDRVIEFVATGFAHLGEFVAQHQQAVAPTVNPAGRGVARRGGDVIADDAETGVHRDRHFAGGDMELGNGPVVCVTVARKPVMESAGEPVAANADGPPG